MTISISSTTIGVIFYIFMVFVNTIGFRVWEVRRGHTDEPETAYLSGLFWPFVWLILGIVYLCKGINWIVKSIVKKLV